MGKTSSLGFCLLGTAMLVLVAGCGNSNPNAPATISGQVTYKGSAVPAGMVTFHVGEGKGGSYTAHLRRDGSYEIADVPVGSAVVTVSTEDYNPKKKTRQYDPKGTADYAKRVATEKPMKETPAEYVAIPKKYGDQKTSPLKATIEAGKQGMDFELTD